MIVGNGACRLPLGDGIPVVEFVAVIISGDNVQQEDVLGFRIKTGDAELHLREHLPVFIK